MKILLLDIETAPNTAHVWGLFKENIPIQRLMESSYVLCWSAKWFGESEILFDSVHRSGPRRMLRRIHRLLDSADAVVHYNGTKFDIPTLNKEFLLHGMKPPAPYKQIDLLKTAKSQFKFPSNKLDYVARALGVKQKVQHIGYELWIRCMNNDKEAWKMMEEYNKGDVITLDEVYQKLLPWIKGHANHSLHSGALVCPHCGSDHYHSRGTYYTGAAAYARYQCQDCGAWFKGGKSKAAGPEGKFLNVS